MSDRTQRGGFSRQGIRSTGHMIPVKVGPRRAGDPPELVADSTLARKTLDWTPKYVEIERIVETAWRWHKSYWRL
jgi:UDP-glucose 4-epimerase